MLRCLRCIARFDRLFVVLVAPTPQKGRPSPRGTPRGKGRRREKSIHSSMPDMSALEAGPSVLAEFSDVLVRLDPSPGLREFERDLEVFGSTQGLLTRPKKFLVPTHKREGSMRITGLHLPVDITSAVHGTLHKVSSLRACVYVIVCLTILSSRRQPAADDNGAPEQMVRCLLRWFARADSV